MAVLFVNNKLTLNKDFVNDSISGATFPGRSIGKTKVGEYQAVVPKVTGSAYTAGFNHSVLEPDDPFGLEGLLIGQRVKHLADRKTGRNRYLLKWRLESSYEILRKALKNNWRKKWKKSKNSQELYHQ